MPTLENCKIFYNADPRIVLLRLLCLPSVLVSSLIICRPAPHVSTPTNGAMGEGETRPIGTFRKCNSILRERNCNIDNRKLRYVEKY